MQCISIIILYKRTYSANIQHAEPTHRAKQGGGIITYSNFYLRFIRLCKNVKGKQS